jgi:hypothetical protein
LDKLKYLLLGGLIAVFLFSCAKKIEDEKTFLERLNEVKVGMTYDEVEELLGKPYEIKRGITMYEAPEKNAYEGSLPDTIKKDPRYISIEPEEKSFGVLIYVSWQYLFGRKVDTVFIVGSKHAAWEYAMRKLRQETIVLSDKKHSIRKFVKTYYVISSYQHVIFDVASGRVSRVALLPRCFLPLE